MPPPLLDSRTTPSRATPPRSSTSGSCTPAARGVPEDDVTAYAWLNIAAAQGQSRANESKEHVAKHMTQSQVAKAQKLSREYWTRYVIPFQ